VSEPEHPGRTSLTRDSRAGRNVLRLPDGPWFPWSREFRWDLMPWNRDLRDQDQELGRHSQLIHLVEAAAGTVGVVARGAGFEFNSAFTGASNGEVDHAVLYEASPNDIADRYPGLVDEDDHCIDLWIHWYPELGLVEVDPPSDVALHDLRVLERADLEEAARQRVTDEHQLRPVLEAWSEVLALWLQGQGTG
jgi:hypothetical protein